MSNWAERERRSLEEFTKREIEANRRFHNQSRMLILAILFASISAGLFFMSI